MRKLLKDSKTPALSKLANMICVPISHDEDHQDNYRRNLFLALMNLHEKEVGIEQLYISAHHFPPQTVSEGKTRLLRPTMTWEE